MKGLYESINSGLDFLLERILDEKKQEISPEDEHDNELIRSAFKKRGKRANAKLSKEEQDALERNGWSVNGKDFNTANGFVEADDDDYVRTRNYTKYGDSIDPYKVFGKYKHVKRQTGEQPWQYTYERELETPPKVNLADMGRKQKERAKNITGDYESRGAKKNQKLWWSTDIVPNPHNRLTAERDQVNSLLSRSKYKKAIDSAKMQNTYISSREQDIQRLYDDSDDKRQYYLDEIKKYKELLANLDSNVEAQADEKRRSLNTIRSNKSELMNKMRDEFKNRRNKNESFHIRKRTKNESFNTHKNK